jgi:hypothetical protein
VDCLRVGIEQLSCDIVTVISLTFKEKAESRRQPWSLILLSEWKRKRNGMGRGNVQLNAEQKKRPYLESYTALRHQGTLRTHQTIQDDLGCRPGFKYYLRSSKIL